MRPVVEAIPMNPEKELALKAHLEAIAQILYDESDPQGMKTLEGIEVTVRQQIQAHVSPELGHFLSERSTVHKQANSAA